MKDEKKIGIGQLKNVSGGGPGKMLLTSIYEAPGNAGSKYDKYEAQGHINEKVYVNSHGSWGKYCWGKLVNSYEKPKGCGSGTDRTQVVYVEGIFNGFSGAVIGENCEFDGDTNYIYQYM